MKKNKKAYSIIIVILTIGFLLVLSISVFNLVLREMQENRWNEDYLRAYAWAEWAMEIALAKLKDKWYWFDKDIDSSNSWSKVLTFDSVFQKWKDPTINYNMDVKTASYSGTLNSAKTETGSFSIIPLFYIEESSILKTDDIKLSWVNADLNWNLIWSWASISWTGVFDSSTKWVWKDSDNNYIEITIKDFLLDYSPAYLMLFNTGDFGTDFSLESEDFFAKPIWEISSSVSVGKYRQNISTKIDNTEYLKMLKYSIYWN